MFSVGKGSIIFTMIEGSTQSLTLLLLYTEEYTLKIYVSVVDIYVLFDSVVKSLQVYMVDTFMGHVFD